MAGEDTMSKRDPRINPRRGDILKIRCYRTVTGVDPLIGVWWVATGGRLSGCKRWSTFRQWHTWAAKATVIHAER